MAILQGHYGKLATLDGRDVRSEADAAAALGIKPGSRRARRWSSPGASERTSMRRAIDLLASADLDLRGRTMLDERLVMELLVARLSKLRR